MVFDKKHTTKLTGLVLLCCFLTGCTAGNTQGFGIWLIYAVTAAIALLILLGYCFGCKRKSAWFLVLFSSIFLINTGYLLLSLSDTLSLALMANRLAYLGSVFLPAAMLMIIMEASNLSRPKWLSALLVGISLVVFLITASQDLCGIYYRSVTLQQIDGISVLKKEYGPLHSSYTFFLLGYFAVMVGAIFYAIAKRKIISAPLSLLLVCAVFVNILVWLIEKLVAIHFELLSVSYIITELFLLGLNILMAENTKKAVPSQPPVVAAPAVPEALQPQFEYFASAIATLTPKERSIFECYTAGMSTEQVLTALSIKENTLKFHNKNIYNKLGVSSRKELLELNKYLPEKS